MLRPSVGELLRGVSAALRESVLPALPSGAAQRQLKAALHLLGRLERSWDRLPGYLEQDNADMRDTMRAVLDALAAAGTEIPAAIAALPDGVPRAEEVRACADAALIADDALAMLAATHIELQRGLTKLESWLRDAGAEGDDDRDAPLRGLYRRMIEREMSAWSTEESGA